MPASRQTLPMATNPAHLVTTADLSAQEREALAAFAQAHGRSWKSELKALWLSGRDEGALRRLRNQLGPSGLASIRL